MRNFIFTPLIVACIGENVIDKQQNEAPTISIQSHSDGAEVLEGYVESFRAQVSDDDNDFEELEVAWFIDEEEICPWTEASSAGESFCDIVFSPEDTSVVAEVRDLQGAGGRAEISISVSVTEAPVVEILSPTIGANYYADQLVQFSALIADAEDPSENLVSLWTSSIDGDLSIDTTVDSSGEISDFAYLTEGEHAIQLLVEDTTGKTTSEELVINVGGNNSDPSCEIIEPSTGSAFVVGQNITFSGIASDVDINNSLLAVSWESNQDGVFDNTAANTDGEVGFMYNGLSQGNHTITLRVEDEVGGLCTDTTIIAVGTPPVLTISSPIDGDITTLGEAVSFVATVNDNEDISSDITLTWDSDLDGMFSNQGSDFNGNISFSEFLSAGIHNITVTATDTTGLTTLTTLSIRVNTPPPAPTVVISPNPVYSNDTITTTVTNSGDADGDTITHSYEWYEDSVLTTHTGSTISASDLDVGEMWTVRVTPNDGYVDGAYSEAYITVSNSIPLVSSVTITPSAGIYNDSVLSCAATATDIDETVTATVEWTIGNTTYSGATLDLSTTGALPTDSIFCTANVSDSNGGTASDSTSVVVENRSPSVSSIVITPATGVLSNTTLSCAATNSDPDGENLTPSYEWMVGSNILGNTDTLMLSNATVQPGDVVSCTAVVNDNYGASATDTTSVTIENTDPTVDSITVSPSSPATSDTITCAATTSDIDGGTPTLTFAFANQSTGATFTNTTTGTNDATLDLSGTGILPDDVIECSVTATDANSGQATAVATVTVINTAPTFSAAATINPSTAVYTGTALTCSATASDIDDGTIAPVFEWTASNSTVASGATYTVDATDTNVGDTITCTATATDSDGESTTTSTSVTVENTDPVLSTVTITPSTGVYNDTTLTCAASATDIDETVVVTYSWAVAGSAVGSGATIDLATTSAQPADSVLCIAAVSDSNSGTDSDSATVTIDNRAPTVPTVSISPSNPVAAVDDLVCSASATDPDGQSLAYSYSWSSDAGATVTGDTVSATLTAPSETWTCTATATDGNLSSSGTASIALPSDSCGIDSSFFPATISGSNYGLGDVSFDGDCNIWSLNYNPPTVVVRDGVSGLEQTVSLNSSGLLGITYRPDDELIYVVGNDKQLFSIDPVSLASTSLGTLSVEVQSLEIVPDTFSTTYAGWLAGGTYNGNVIAIDPATQQEVTLVSLTDQISDIQFSSTGDLYATHGKDLTKVEPSGTTINLGTSFNEADGIAIDEVGERIFVADSGTDILHEYDMISGSVQNIGSYDFDSGYFTSGLLFGENGVLLLLTGESSQTQYAIVP